MKKIKVLWLCNMIVPQFCTMLEVAPGYGGGWVEETLEKIALSERCELAYCAPFKSEDKIVECSYKGVRFYGFNKKEWRAYKYDEEVEEVFRDILNDFQPDIVHIFGTEFPHSLAMAKAFNNPERTIVHIQGLISICAQYYFAFLPEKVIYGYSFRDFLRKDNIFHQYKKFKERGKFEKEALKTVAHVMGRTEWDYMCVKQINQKIKYHYCEENLRNVFYDASNWAIEKCEKHTIFMSQGNYPVKGLHIALEALKIVKEEFPGVKLRIAGDDIIKTENVQDRIRKSYYAKYISKLIKELNLDNNVEFVGCLNSREMCSEYLRANVYILPSVIENSPNSLGEAMFLGTPAVAAGVGGVSSLMQHGKEGFVYQVNAPYMLAYYIMKIFEDEALAKLLSMNSRKKMKEKENISQNVSALMRIYSNVLETN